MWKRVVERVVERVPEERLEALSLQLRELEARVKGLETSGPHPATVARLDSMESKNEQVMMDWALMRQKLTRLFGQITKTQAVDRQRAEESVEHTPQTADEVMELARQKGIVR